MARGLFLEEAQGKCGVRREKGVKKKKSPEKGKKEKEKRCLFHKP